MIRKRGLRSSVGDCDLDECKKRSTRATDVVPTLVCEVGRPRGTELCIIFKGLLYVPPEVFDYTALTYLTLSSNKIRTMPSELGLLTALRKLYLCHNLLTYLPSSISKLTSLEVLSLTNNRFASFPRGVESLTALRLLCLCGNRLRLLPRIIGKMTALRDLYLTSNKLTQLPREIGCLTALSELFVGYNKLTALPDEVCNLTALRVLSLNSNPLIAVPQQISCMTNLADLWLEGIKMSSLPGQILERLSYLSTLGIKYNSLTRLPSVMFKLPRLERLYVGWDSFASLPSTVRIADEKIKYWLVSDMREKDRIYMHNELALPYYDVPFAHVGLFFSVLPRDCNDVIDGYVNPPVVMPHQ